ncbi:MAG: ABC transporter ATP-binding protein [Planctomycetota bacterium]|jgi:ABC-2 type transport system ATP-binding protein
MADVSPAAVEPESAAADEPALRVDDCSYTYPPRRRQPTRRALDRLSLEVPAGQSVSLLGPNGSGKSTLMRIVCGLLPVPRRVVSIFGAPADEQARAALGVVFQSPGLDPFVTVRENLIDQGRLYGLSRADAAARTEETLERADLGDRAGALVKTLSGGLVRRVDLCRALLHRPRLLLLDEPTVGLDPAARESFLAQLEELRAMEGLTLMMSTHLVDEADRCDRVVLVHAGRVVADDAPAALREALGSRRVTVHLATWHPPAGDDDAWTRGPGGWIRPLTDGPSAAGSIAAVLTDSGVPFTIAPPTLADVFEQRTGTSLSGQDAESGPASFSLSQESENVAAGEEGAA